MENEHFDHLLLLPSETATTCSLQIQLEKKEQEKDNFIHSPSLIFKITFTFLPSLISQTMSTIHQTHTRREGEDKEFSFWGSSNIIPSENDCDQPQGNESRLKKEAYFGETHQRKSLKYEYSRFCSTVSDPSRSKAISEGQRELMEMMQDMPESGYELSFQDMVVHEKQVLEPEQQPHQNETSLENTLMQSSSGNKAQLKRVSKKKKNKGNSRPGQILRVESMDSETFLLKLFFPISLDWMKKDRAKNGSKVSSRPSLQESIKQVGKEWTIKRLFLSGDNREDGICQKNGGRSISDINE